MSKFLNPKARLEIIGSRTLTGEKIHMDGSVVDANVSKNSVVKGSEEMSSRIRSAVQSQVQKLDEEQELARQRKYHPTVNDKAVSLTDPDAALVRKAGESRPRYKSHRVVDDAHGVITAVISTPGSVKENGQLMNLVDQHETNTGSTVTTVIADRQYGTAENFRACQERNISSHMGDLLESQKDISSRQGIYPEAAFIYDDKGNAYRCPAGQWLRLRNHRSARQASEYAANHKVCEVCDLRSSCTRATTGGRSLKRHEGHDLIARGRAQSQSLAAYRDRRRRKWMMEGSFADAANNHGFKRARWRRLWRQQIQDWLIAAVQNVRILLRSLPSPRSLASGVICPGIVSHGNVFAVLFNGLRPARFIPVMT